MQQFIPGLQLNEAFYNDVVGPLLKEYFPNLTYAAGLVGHGSDVFGFDSPTSMDHNWGPYLHIFFTERDFVAHKHEVDTILQEKLPYTYKGFSTHFVKGDRYRVDIPRIKKSGKVSHLFRFWTIESFFMHYLGFDIKTKPSFQNWLLFPQQALIEVTAGKIFHDDLNLIDLRRAFSYYPDDIWKYMLAVQWGKIRDEIQFQARSAEEGDELGSRVVVARTMKKLMFLSFLIERRYVPYSKWIGLAFKSWLKLGNKLYPLLLDTLRENDWIQRQSLLTKALRIVGEAHNKLGITKPITTEIVDFYGRGYPMIDVWKFEEETHKSIKNEQLKSMKFPLGNIDQFIDHARINHINYFYTELKDIIK